MTTIVYNNEIIVADCMSTISYRNKSERAYCPSCGTESDIRSHTRKFRNVAASYDKDTTICGATGSGSTQHLDFLALSMNCIAMEKGDVKGLWDAYRRDGGSVLGGNAALITTDGKVMLSSTRSYGARKLESGMERSGIAIGSGADTATAAVELGLSPLSANILAGLMDNGTGAGVEFVDLKHPQKFDSAMKANVLAVHTLEDVLKSTDRKEQTYIEYVTALRDMGSGDRALALYKLDNDLRAYLEKARANPPEVEVLPAASASSTPTKAIPVAKKKGKKA